MDSRKFKKMNKEAPKLKHKKKKTKINYKNIIIIVLLIFIIFFVGSTVLGVIDSFRLPQNAQLIQPTKFNFTPYGYEWDNQLYGNCIATNSNGTEDHYYFTLSQMAALARHSKNSFNYSDGIYINYTYDENYGIKIVDKIYDINKNEIRKPANYNEYEFSQNARFLERDSQYITEDFGFTPQEYADSTLSN